MAVRFDEQKGKGADKAAGLVRLDDAALEGVAGGAGDGEGSPGTSNRGYNYKSFNNPDWQNSDKYKTLKDVPA